MSHVADHEGASPAPGAPDGDAEHDGARPGFLTDLRDAVSPRTVALIVGVLVVQLAFVLSYVGAFHAPRPHGVSYTVAGPAQVTAPLVQQLDAVAGDPLSASAVADEAAARRRLVRDQTSAALVIDPTGTHDTLLVASGGGASLVTAMESVTQQVETRQGRTYEVVDVVPLQSGDGRGLSGFYLVTGWIVGGYLLAALLEVSKGARRTTGRRIAFRLLAMVPYAVLSGLGGALIVDQVLGALTGHFLALWGLGTLLVLAAGTVTMAFQTLLGTLGIGVTILVFVVAGNPSAGGAYATQLLPAFWRWIGPLLPNGAGTEAVRRIAYFPTTSVAGQVTLIAGYAVIGAVVALLVASAKERRRLAVAR